MVFRQEVFKALFYKYQEIIIFDFETTGLNAKTDDIIDIGLIKLTPAGRFNFSFLLRTDKKLSDEIVNLTHISNSLLEKDGEDRSLVANRLNYLLNSRSTLLVGYNVNFDLGFLLEFAKKYGFYEKITSFDYIDVMTIFKDDKFSYPHKLADAIRHYLVGGVSNTHRAFDDAEATLGVFQEMCKSSDDILNYTNVFGFNPKYERTLIRLPGIRYVPQPYEEHPRAYSCFPSLEAKSTKDKIVSPTYHSTINKVNGFDIRTTQKIYDLGLSYFNQGYYGLSHMILQNVVWYSNAKEYLTKCEQYCIASIGETVRQIALAQIAIILHRYEEAYMRYSCAGEYDKAEEVWEFINHFENLQKFINFRCTYADFQRLLEKDSFKEFLTNYPSYKEDRRNNLETKYLGERIVRIIVDSNSFRNVCNTFSVYLDEEERDLAFGNIRNHFPDFIRNYSAARFLTQALFDFINSKQEYKDFFYKAFLVAYAKQYLPPNDPLNLYRDNKDICKIYLDTHDSPNDAISNFALTGKVMAESAKEKLLVFRSHFRTNEFIAAKELSAALEPSQVWQEIEGKAKRLVGAREGEALMNALIKTFAEYEYRILCVAYDSYKALSKDSKLDPATHKQSFSDPDVYDQYVQKFGRDSAELQRCVREDLQEQNRFLNRLKAFFNGPKVIKDRQEAQSQKIQRENLIFVVAIKYGFSLATLNEWRSKNGGSSNI